LSDRVEKEELLMARLVIGRTMYTRDGETVKDTDVVIVIASM